MATEEKDIRYCRITVEQSDENHYWDIKTGKPVPKPGGKSSLFYAPALHCPQHKDSTVQA